MVKKCPSMGPFKFILSYQENKLEWVCKESDKSDDVYILKFTDIKVDNELVI